MNPFQRQPDRAELMAMLKGNAMLFSVYLGAIRATPLVRHRAALGKTTSIDADEGTIADARLCVCSV